MSVSCDFIRKSVKLSALKLDEVKPYWFSQVNLDILDENDSHKDVAYQVFGSWMKAVTAMPELDTSSFLVQILSSIYV